MTAAVRVISSLRNNHRQWAAVEKHSDLIRDLLRLPNGGPDFHRGNDKHNTDAKINTNNPFSLCVMVIIIYCKVHMSEFRN